jgi:hypothetical protein
MAKRWKLGSSRRGRVRDIVTVRNPADGGDQERELVGHYGRDAEALRFDWPPTTACLERIAETYECDARRQDEGGIGYEPREKNEPQFK